MMVVYFIFVAGFLILSCVMCQKCMSRRQEREHLKAHMEIRRREFAALQGVELYQSNKMNMHKTIHL